MWWRIANASFDPYSEAVVKSGAFTSASALWTEAEQDLGGSGSSLVIDSLGDPMEAVGVRSGDGIGLAKRRR